MLGRSYHIGTYSGIPVKIHWTFGLLVLTLLFLEYRDHQTISGLVYMMLYIFSLFFCVVLHEYGHALTAKRYGINTRDIILSPIGGLARLEDIPEEPIKELLIAIAGPLVNLVIASLVGIGIFLCGISLVPDFNSVQDLYNPSGMIALLFWMNVVLFVFNLVPAFPMDGGRILRSVLSMKFDRIIATRIAMIIARVIAVLGFCYAIYHSEMILTVISIFIFYTAGAEYRQILLKKTLKHTAVSSVMLREFSKITIDDSYHDLVKLYRTTGENNFLLYSDNEILGTIPAAYIANYFKDHSVSVIGSTYRNGYQSVGSDSSLYQVFELMQKDGIAIVAITDSNDEVIGVLDRQMFSNWMSQMSHESLIQRFRNWKSKKMSR